MDIPYIRDTAAAIISMSGRATNGPICDQDPDEYAQGAMQITMQPTDRYSPMQITVQPTRGTTPNMYQSTMPQNMQGYRPMPYTQQRLIITPEWCQQPQRYNNYPRYTPMYTPSRSVSPDYYGQSRNGFTPDYYSRSPSPNVLTISMQPQHNTGHPQVYRLPLQNTSPQIGTYGETSQAATPKVIQIAVQPNPERPDFSSMPPQATYTKTKNIEISIQPGNTIQEPPAPIEPPSVPVVNSVEISIEPNTMAHHSQNELPKVVQISVAPSDIALELGMINGQRSQATAPSAVHISVQPNASVASAQNIIATQTDVNGAQVHALESVTVNGQPVHSNGQNPIQIHVQPNGAAPTVVEFDVLSPDATAGRSLEIVVQQNSAAPSAISIIAQPSHSSPVTSQMLPANAQVPQVENIALKQHYDPVSRSMKLDLEISVLSSQDVAHIDMEYPCMVEPVSFDISLNPPRPALTGNMQAGATTSVQMAKGVCITMQPLFDTNTGPGQTPQLAQLGKQTHEEKFAPIPENRGWMQAENTDGRTGIARNIPGKLVQPSKQTKSSGCANFRSFFTNIKRMFKRRKKAVRGTTGTSAKHSSTSKRGATRGKPTRSARQGKISENDWENDNMLPVEGWVKYWNTETKQFLYY